MHQCVPQAQNWAFSSLTRDVVRWSGGIMVRWVVVESQHLFWRFCKVSSIYFEWIKWMSSKESDLNPRGSNPWNLKKCPWVSKGVFGLRVQKTTPLGRCRYIYVCHVHEYIFIYNIYVPQIHKCFEHPMWLLSRILSIQGMSQVESPPLRWSLKEVPPYMSNSNHNIYKQ